MKDNNRKDVMRRKWEYQEKVVTSVVDVVQAANQEGQDGWELVTVISDLPLDRKIWLFFKREISLE